MRPGDTIAAQATPHGRGPRAVIRLSGSDTPRILGRIHLHAPTAPGAHRARLRLPTDAGDTDLPCLLLLFAAPRSYTGEHAAELQLPSNPALIDRVLALLLSQEGVRLAEPGEFTARAFLNNRMTLEQAEGVQAVISARSAEELAAAQRLLAGDVGEAYRAAADELADLLALVEAAIDFTDQESVVPITPERFVHSLRNVLFGLDALAGPSASDAPSSRPRIVLAGPPNAGKSTLFNALLGRERAVVSETPGTTRDAVAEALDLPVSAWETRSITLVDLAGLDRALADRSPLDHAAQLAARREIERADAVIHCDPSGRFEPLPADLSRKRLLRLRTKADLPHEAQTGGAGFQPAILSVCALDGWNLDPLHRALADLAWAGAAPAAAIDAAVVPRHRRALADACDALRRALAAAKPDERLPAFRAPEVIAGELRLALDALGAITGRVAPDDVLGRVFRFFCVGK